MPAFDPVQRMPAAGQRRSRRPLAPGLRPWFKWIALRARLWVAASAILGELLLSGCSGRPPASTSAPAGAPLVWPAAPEAPRIAYVQSAFQPADLGVQASAITRFGRWLTGSDKGSESFIKPFGLALDENDNLCLTDTGANVVCFYDRARKKWQRWNKVGAVRFAAPVAVVKRKGIIYVADSALGAVVVFDESARLLRQITDHLERPAGLAVADDQLFVTDSQRHCVVVFDLQGQYRSQFGSRGVGEGQFNFPTHIAADAEGNLFVTDSMNSRVQMLDSRGRFQSQIGSLGDSPGQFSRPKGVAVDALAHVYVVDALFDNIQIFDHRGQFLLTLGAAGSQPGQFWLPNGIAISRSNEVFVADSYNRRVQIFKYVGPS